MKSTLGKCSSFGRLVAPVSSGYTVTDITKTFVSGGVRQTYDDSSPGTVSGTLTTGLSAGEVLGSRLMTALLGPLLPSTPSPGPAPIPAGPAMLLDGKGAGSNLAGEYGTVVRSSRHLPYLADCLHHLNGKRTTALLGTGLPPTAPARGQFLAGSPPSSRTRLFPRLPSTAARIRFSAPRQGVEWAA